MVKVVFANILGGREFLGTSYGSSEVGDFVLDTYITDLQKSRPDLLSLAEIHLEDKNRSTMVEVIADRLDLPYYDFMGSDASHLEQGKLLGNAIFSRYPITKTDHFIVDAPALEVDRPNGEHWTLHNKLAQTAFIAVNGTTITLTSLHYFPFHHFKRVMNDPEFAPQRSLLVNHLTDVEPDTIPIITGDFNNKGISLRQAFPELFTSGFDEAVEVETTIKGGREQFDHILFRPEDCTRSHAAILHTPSDHYALTAELAPRTVR